MKNTIFVILLSCLACNHVPAGTEQKKITVQVDNVENLYYNGEKEYSQDPNKREFRIYSDNNLSYALKLFHLEDIYSDALWRVYCLYCGKYEFYKDSVKLKYKLGDSVSYGTIRLQLGSIKLLTLPLDTNAVFYELNFDAFNEEVDPHISFFTLIDGNKTIQHQRIDNCIGKGVRLIYKYNGKAPVGFTIMGGDVYYLNEFLPYNHNSIECTTAIAARLAEPLETEVISYIRLNFTNLDPRFYYEAIRRGVLDSVKHKRKSYANSGAGKMELKE